MFKNIIELSKKRINYLHNIDNRWFYNWPQTYFDCILDELKEAKAEYKTNNSIYLEDELWDVFWDYICLLHSLEKENMINTKNVFERCYKKFNERIQADWNSISWQEIKKKQKDELKKEHNLKYNK